MIAEPVMTQQDVAIYGDLANVWLLKPTQRYGNLTVMECIFAVEASVVMHAPSILKIGSDASNRQ